MTYRVKQQKWWLWLTMWHVSTPLQLIITPYWPMMEWVWGITVKGLPLVLSTPLDVNDVWTKYPFYENYIVATHLRLSTLTDNRHTISIKWCGRGLAAWLVSLCRIYGHIRGIVIHQQQKSTHRDDNLKAQIQLWKCINQTSSTLIL